MGVLSTLEDLGIVFEDIEADMYKLFPKSLFDSQLEIKQIDMWIPSNDLFNVAMYQLDPNEELESMPDKTYGLSIEPIDGWDDVSLVAPSALLPVPLPVSVSAIVENSTDEIIFTKHGDNLLIETGANPRYVSFETKVSKKNKDTIDNDIRLDFMAAYHYLYRGNTNEAYSYIRNISSAIKNTFSKNKRTKQERRLSKSRVVKAWQL